jgi:hypothetical protein
MTRVLVLLLVLLTSSIASAPAFAQEFKLEIIANNKTPPSAEYQWVFPVFLGYDVAAGDTLENKTKAWKEERTAPDPIGKVILFEQAAPENTEGRELAFRDPFYPDTLFAEDSLELTKMDIRFKPATDTFMMKWRLFVDPENGLGPNEDKMVLTWDRNKIPAQVRHMIMSYIDGEQIVDMKNTGSVTIWGDSLAEHDGFQNIKEVIITLYHNLDIKADVNYDRANVISLRAYPNPAISHSKILLELKQTEFVSLAIYDVQGREVMSHSFMGMMGMNEISLDRKQLGLSSGVYFVRAMVGSGSDQVLKTTSIRLQ